MKDLYDGYDVLVDLEKCAKRRKGSVQDLQLALKMEKVYNETHIDSDDPWMFEKALLGSIFYAGRMQGIKEEQQRRRRIKRLKKLAKVAEKVAAGGCHGHE